MATIHDTLTLALNRHMAGQFAEAEALYARVLDAAPDHPDALHLSGMLLGQAGRFDVGLERVARAVALRPEAADFRINRAVLLEAAGHHADALDAARRAMALNPAFAEGWTDLSALLRGAGRTDAAIAALDRAIRLNPALDPARDRLALLLREKGRLMVDMGRNREALPTLERAAALAPLDADIAFWQANALYAHGRLDRAAAAYGRAAAVVPDFASALFNLGVTRIHRLELEAGAAVLGWVQRLLPEAEEPRETRLAALVRCGRWEEVRRESTELTALKTQSGDDLPTAHLSDTPRAENLRSLDVVAFSLWGEQPLHAVGAVENARLVPLLHPGWECRVYHDGSVSPAVLDALADAGARLVPMPDGGDGSGVYWRYLVSDDPVVRRFVCRGCHARLNPREAAAVRDWIASGQQFHVMRDHALHTDPILGGMWGGMAGVLPPLGPLVGRFTRSATGLRQDRRFLRHQVWPLIRARALVHDAHHPGFGVLFPPVIDAGPAGHVGAAVPV
ncbi:tetratricopeptide (TPR) repeat protein [Azospirillum fermentarium]|uniref:tetratricopeptide repeat protein n=1 Tax=Azospirillum fermentarium TaxID=1233114 RepID=UPI00222609AC|nr:tetratricopeptide repeat protein [Azospirillum fermentarium]MCW2247506.1 tetratricopeptide (TPR) repeat protein [Azospirillum fermentarium]